MKKSNPLALIPIGVFVIFYLSLGVIFEYVMKIPMGFYSVPVVVAFLVALFVAVLQTKGESLDKKFEIMGTGVGDKNIITMLLIFMLAGIFVGVVGRSSAESVAYFMLSVTPPRIAVVVIFIVACFVSTAMGTSVGTITLLTPIALAIAEGSGFSVPLCVGTVVGGAMFGDNMSMISDTTIAATRTQNVAMRDKFITNFKMILPAAVLTVILYYFAGRNFAAGDKLDAVTLKHIFAVVPYIFILAGALLGMNVMALLFCGMIMATLVGILFVMVISLTH